jgi:hypothetical protein
MNQGEWLLPGIEMGCLTGHPTFDMNNLAKQLRFPTVMSRIMD